MECEYILGNTTKSVFKILSFSYDGKNKITVECEKTYDCEGPNGNSSATFEWKLYDKEGYIVDSGIEFMSPNAVVGDKEKITIYLLNYKRQSDCTLYVIDSK